MTTLAGATAASQSMVGWTLSFVIASACRLSITEFWFSNSVAPSALWPRSERTAHLSRNISEKNYLFRFPLLPGTPIAIAWPKLPPPLAFLQTL